MEFTLHEIGHRIFVVIDGYVAAYNGKVEIKDSLIDNLQENFNNIKDDYKTEEEAKKRFLEIIGAKYLPEWLDYQYDGDFLTLLKEDGFRATLPIQRSNGEFIKIEIVLYREDKEERMYSVLINGRPEGSLVVQLGEDIKSFYEHFIADVCFYNSLQIYGEIKNPYFPFESYYIRSEYNFYPALVMIDTNHHTSLNDMLRSMLH